MKPDWLSFDEALARVRDGVSPLDSELCPIRKANGRVLAADVVAPVDIPRWTNSAMDGYAVRRADLGAPSAEQPTRLLVVGDIAAGGFPDRSLGAGEAMRIMTGAAVPEGADTVVRVEHTDGGMEHVAIFDASDGGRNVRPRGEDLREGTIAIPAGTVLTPAGLGVAASLGYAEAKVVRRPRVAVVTSGDELVEVEQFDEVREGRRIVSSNSYTLRAQLEAAGCEVRYLGISPDQPARLRELLLGAEGCDAVITSAGISVGEHDHVKAVLADLETQVDFWRVRIRPGSPFAFGHIGALGNVPWFGLPGNPVSSMVTFELFARPALLRMGGRERIYREPITAQVNEKFPVAENLLQFLRVKLVREDGGWEASLTGAQGSGVLSSLVLADGLLMVPPGSAPQRGVEMRVIPLNAAPRTATAWS